ncbi:MAG: diguanylate cyclase [Planctomycetales bacterium]|nr:diguanylate cyclase [Planctomycetales bacterium]
MRDVSSETDLEKQCATLHEKATRDPLTKVANRAEFDRQHEAFVEQHRNRDEPGSLIICDIDHFKGINDTYGHPAGDDALRRFAQMLAENCRPGDLVARYGGEEFVLLCADCDQAAASRRAEKIRHQIANTPLSVLGGKRITASFGVTQTAAEDTPSLMLGRADKALLEAKAAGRNLVVTVSPDGVGRMTRSAGGWFPWWQPGAAVPVAKTELLADVPLGVAIEKLRGFVAEHKAHVKPLDDHRVMLRFEPKRGGILRRESDRAVAFLLELGFCEEATLGGSRPGQVRTRVTVAVRPRRGRDRRRRDVVARARAVINYLQTYLIARPADGNEEPVERRETDLTGTWLEA